MTSRLIALTFVLPAGLLSQGFALRPETDADIPFLLRLYASTREEELAAVPWSAEQKQAFLAQQFDAQRQHYLNYIGACTFDVIEHNGEPAGRLYLDARPSSLHIVDVALLPAWRGHGVGAAILEGLQAAVGVSGKTVSTFVEKFNPALRLYRRLGFGEVADHGIYLEMEWSSEAVLPSGAASSPAIAGSFGS
ncbi:MAG: GNAT family N-acetyltransferase [Xanthobacteraceae bacterium]